MIDFFTVNFERKPDTDFSAEELRHLRRVAREPFDEGGSAQVAALFQKRGVYRPFQKRYAMLKFGNKTNSKKKNTVRKP